MTRKKRLFVAEYLKDLNATQAAIRAGYSPKSAGATGYDLLNEPEISAELAKSTQKRLEDAGIDANKVLKELGLLAFANIGDFLKITPEGDPMIDLSKMTREQSAALAAAEVEDYVEGRGDNSRAVRRVKIKMIDKRAALVDLGKYLGLFVERRMDVGPPVPVQVQFVE